MSLVARYRHIRNVHAAREHAQREDSERKICRWAQGEKMLLSGERNPKFPLYAQTKLAAGDQPLSAWEKVRPSHEPLTRLRHCKDRPSSLWLVFPF